ncbi:4'-phosphopantetheinyl transferase superfamily protein [Streptomyces sp. NPDC047987]|uniref:4'-phosphopantetheinyl transferase family protein n=1 Tax=unclassified Streptomyces TaxID=2593676 RepID=UPI00343D1A76
MIERILPSRVVVEEAFSDPPHATLFPAEEELVRNSVEVRRREFTTVRHCARRALGALGVAPAPILKGERGAPVWPPATVGSMTHCAGYRAAAVARRADVRTIGIDAEPHAPLPDDVHDSVALATEQRRERELRERHPGIHWDRLLFSAKESVYKTWFPLTHRWLGFEQADIVLRPDGSFNVELLVSAEELVARADVVPGSAPGSAPGTAPQAERGAACDTQARPSATVPVVPRELRGRWLVADGLLATAIVIENAPDTP